MPSIALIACDNGYGHVRRCLILAREMCRKGWDVTLLAPSQAIKRFERLVGIPSEMKIVDFNTNTTVDGFRSGQSLDWYKNLPDLDRYDVVLSDNLPEILHIRSDLILSGSFLWHRIVEGVSDQVRSKTDELLLRHHPVMISSGLFSGQEVRELTDIREVGLFVSNYQDRPVWNGSLKKDIMIACGRTDSMTQKYREGIERIIDLYDQLSFNVWVDQSLLPSSYPAWMKPAMFSPEMFQRLSIAIIRPGIGTITECLWHGVWMISVYEAGNIEVKFNADRLMSEKLGETRLSVTDAFELSKSYLMESMNPNLNAQNYSRVSFSGSKEAVEQICLIQDSQKI